MILPWLKAFLLTCALELPLAGVLLRRVEPRLGRLLALLVLANLCTHPLVWFVFPELPLPYPLWLTLAELWAWLGEAAVFRLLWPALTWPRALGVALLANGFSFAAGFGLMSWRADWFLS